MLYAPCRQAQLKSRGITVTKDELFTLENSLPQACFSAALNDRYVSVKQGQCWDEQSRD